MLKCLKIVLISSLLISATTQNVFSADFGSKLRQIELRLRCQDVSHRHSREETLKSLNEALDDLANLTKSELNIEKDALPKEMLYRQLLLESKILFWKGVTLDVATDYHEVISIHRLGLEKAYQANGLMSEKKKDFQLADAAFLSLVHQGKMLEQDRDLNLVDKLYRLFEMRKTVRKAEKLKTIENEPGSEYERSGSTRFLSLLNGEACKKKRSQSVMDFSIDTALDLGLKAYQRSPAYGLNAFAYAFALSIKDARRDEANKNRYKEEALSVIDHFLEMRQSTDRSSDWFVEVEFELRELTRLRNEISLMLDKQGPAAHLN